MRSRCEMISSEWIGQVYFEAPSKFVAAVQITNNGNVSDCGTVDSMYAYVDDICMYA